MKTVKLILYVLIALFVGMTLFMPATSHAQPGITDPSGPALECGDVTFQWNTAIVDAWWLWVGPCDDPAYGQCGDDYYTSGQLPNTTLTATVSNLPTDGSPVFARIWFLSLGVWDSVLSEYTAATGCNPEITDPLPGPPLSGPTVTFFWNQGQTAVTHYGLWVGTSPLGKDLYESPILPITTLSAEVSGLPTDGSPVYVTLWWSVDGGVTYQSVTYTYESATVIPLDNPVIKEVAFERGIGITKKKAAKKKVAKKKISLDSYIERYPEDLLYIAGKNFFEMNDILTESAGTNEVINGDFPKVTLGLDSAPLACYPYDEFFNMDYENLTAETNNLNGEYQILVCEIPFRLAPLDYVLKLCNAPMVCDSRMVTIQQNVRLTVRNMLDNLCYEGMDAGAPPSDICIAQCRQECERPYLSEQDLCRDTYWQTKSGCESVRTDCLDLCPPSASQQGTNVVELTCQEQCQLGYDNCEGTAANVRDQCLFVIQTDINDCYIARNCQGVE